MKKNTLESDGEERRYVVLLKTRRQTQFFLRFKMLKYREEALLGDHLDGDDDLGSDLATEKYCNNKIDLKKLTMRRSPVMMLLVSAFTPL